MAIIYTLERAATADSDTSSITSDELPVKLALLDSPLQEVVHKALQLRASLRDARGHCARWQGINNDHVVEIITDSLHLFLIVLLRWDVILETQVEQEINEPFQMRICNTA